jgi:1-acyl-sn-glycerol-3-phosphate acyltransferase
VTTSVADADLPCTDDVRALPDALMRPLRFAARPWFHRRYDLHLHHADRVPSTGPVLLTPNHVGYLDGPLLVGMAPRPVHAMVKLEMFRGTMALLLNSTGQIPLDRFAVDVNAVKLALKALRDGKVVAIYPEGGRGAGDARYVKRGWAYLALVTGTPIVPVATFGTRLPGESVETVPPRGARIDIVYGEPITVEPRPWPRRSDEVRTLTRELQQMLAAHVAASARMVGAPASPDAPDGDEPEPGSIGFGALPDRSE